MKTAKSSRMQERVLVGTTVMMGLIAAAGAQSGTPSAAPAATGKVTNVSAGAATNPAQAAVMQTPAPAQATLTPPATNRVGDATSYLLALQASGQYASRNSYPMTSDVALRTYQRYLESFTHKIPESSETQVGNKSGGGR